MTADTRSGPDAVLRELQWVRRLARRLLADEALADDVAQDAWLAARDGLPRDDGREGGLRRWLATVVRNRVRRALRGERRRVAREQTVLAVREVVDAADPADVVARVALHTEVAQAVAALDEPFRSALSWHYLDELPATEVARRQGIRHDAARKRISRGLQLLRERLATVHPGGFVAWCVDWTRVLGPAAAATASVPLLTVILMKKWWLMSGAAAVALWLAWPEASNAPPQPGGAVAQAPLAERAALDGDAAGTAPPRVDATDAKVGVRLVDDAGRALAGVQVLALRDGGLVAAARSDEAGRADFAAPLRADEWLLARAGALPLRCARRAAADAGASAEQSIVWPAGHVVAGEARDASRLVAALRLEHDRSAPVFAGLDAAVVAVLDTLGLRADGVDLALDEQGRFRCVGLATDWSGAVVPPPGYTLREPSCRGVVDRSGLLLLRQPAADLVLQLSPPLLVRGRVLVAGAPAPGLRACAAWLDDDGAPQPRVTGDDGRFAVPLRAPGDDDGRPASLLVVDEHDGPLLRVPLRATPGQAELDVGDLALDGPLEVLVLGADDAPLVGARVSVGGEVPVSQLADAAGRVHFAATPPGADRVLAHADGHRAERRPVPADRRQTIRLVPTNQLVVHAVAADGSTPAAALALEVAAARPFLPGARGEALKGENGRYGLLLTLDELGRAQLSDLEPGVLVQLAVRDDLGQVVAEHTVATPAPGQRTTVELSTTARMFAFGGVVRDQQGRPVARARLHVEADGFAVHGRTDADGRFALGPLRRAMRDVHVEVVHPAFVTWVRNDVAIDVESAPLEVVLEAGRVVEVAVLQASGEPLPAGTLLAELGDSGGLARNVAPGRYLFQGLAQRAGRVYVQLGGREFAVPIGAQDSFVELRVPDLGAVVVSLADAVEQRGVRLCVAISEVRGEVAGEVVDRDYFRVGEPAVRTLWLPAGSYRLQLEQRRMGRRGFQVLGERVVEVRPGASVELALP